MSIARHVAIVGAATLTSRVLGFARDVAIAGLFGAGARADAFVVAFQFSNLVRRLLTEGALNAAVVPLYLSRRDEGGETAAAAFAGQAIGTLTIVLIGVAAALALAMPILMLALAPGFVESPARLSLAIELARLMLPYLVLAGPVAVLTGILNANHRFASAALAGLMFNVVILVAIAVIVLMRSGDSDLSAWIIAIAVAVAGLCQLALVGIAVLAGPEKAAPPGLLPRDQTRRFLTLAIPGLVAGGIPQLTMIVGVMVVSDLPGAAALLYYAHRLVEFPLGMVGIAIGTVMTPALSHAARGADAERGPRTTRHGIEMALGLALPAAVALTLLAFPIARILFERGAFTSADSASTSTLLAALALGLPGHVLVKALSPVFFAREDTRTPMLAAGAGLIAAALGGIVLMQAIGVVGAALAIALSGWIGAVMLWLIATRRGLLTAGVISWQRLSLIALAALIMGISVRLLAMQVGLLAVADVGRVMETILLAAVIVFGIAFYTACLWLFGIVRAEDLRASVRLQ